ncbi:hypothetical protein HYH02_014269 [Chlamydomonas schloesseri]|uniref:Uncharacterized protein n=1 Tax=Chlamydomonas schloesseri TaxID=2026947 RepID=A0A835SKP5_9CHLO|nr:hypothetical protein HYH02_014269 [Chlamydomonas schloesseri]|eukprot:KAG2428858.1 hypothetical protein HYH02_014269 [Chlamydomonas schloesseri]
MDGTPRSDLRRRPAAVSGGTAGTSAGGLPGGDNSDSGGAFSPAAAVVLPDTIYTTAAAGGRGTGAGGGGGGGFAAAHHKIMMAEGATAPTATATGAGAGAWAGGAAAQAPSGPEGYGTGTGAGGLNVQQQQQQVRKQSSQGRAGGALAEGGQAQGQRRHDGDSSRGSGSPSASARSQQQQQQQQQQLQPGAGQLQPGGGKQLPPDFFLDEEAEAARHPFPLPPAELIARAKQVLAVGVAEWPHLAPDFEFSAPFIGPLGPAEFRKTMRTLGLEAAFPDLSPRYHHFRVDPFRPNRVWFTLQPRCTHTGTFKGKLPFGIAPTGRHITEPPQTASLAFNAAGEVAGHTMGYVMDRGAPNSTGGLGGAFGLMWALGAPLPAPEGRPWSPSLQLRLLNGGGWLVQAAVFLFDRITSALLPAAWLTRHSRNTM